MKKAVVMLPCYNEEPNIQPLVEKWQSLLGEYRQRGYQLSVICIDDCSKDQTRQRCEDMAAAYPETVRLIVHEENQGLGGGVRTAFETFVKEFHPGDLCVLMDGDNTHDPVYSLPMLDLIAAGSDCVIASRYVAGSKTKGVPDIRLFLSGGARWFYTLLLRVKNVKDYTCGYRMYTYDLILKALRTYGDDLVERRSFACMMEALYKLSLLGARFSEVPFTLRYDHKQGESKMRTLKTISESVQTAFSLRFRGGVAKKSRSQSARL